MDVGELWCLPGRPSSVIVEGSRGRRSRGEAWSGNAAVSPHAALVVSNVLRVPQILTLALASSCSWVVDVVKQVAPNLAALLHPSAGPNDGLPFCAVPRAPASPVLYFVGHAQKRIWQSGSGNVQYPVLRWFQRPTPVFEFFLCFVSSQFLRSLNAFWS